MTSLRSVELPLVGTAGHLAGTLRVSLLPQSGGLGQPAPLVDVRDDPNRDSSVEPVQLLEAEEYVYEIVSASVPVGRFTTNRPEIFQPDTDRGDRGRLRTSAYTGALEVRVNCDAGELGMVTFEVRSRKLDYLSEYRWMLRDVAEQLAEVVMERFAPTQQRFAVDETRDAATLYQRFAFLRALLADEAFDAAVHQILARPHRAWITDVEARPPSQGVRAHSAIVTQLCRPGPRIQWPLPNDERRLSSLPSRLLVPRTDETLDNAENRFVKFALSRWRDAIGQLRDGLARSMSSAPVRRGVREADALLQQIDALLGEELFRQLGPLNQLPVASQVLHKREGYRDVFRAYVQFEAAALLTWDGGDDVYAAGQRDVATLYEFWVYLQLAQVVSRLCETPMDFGALLRVQKDGLGIILRRGKQAGLSAAALRLGRKLEIALYFNRTFASGGAQASSWTRPMRPDCSLQICARDAGNYPLDEVWLHFDAKYRVEGLVDLFGSQGAVGAEQDAMLLEQLEQAELRGEARRSDLLKMHAYRDAIRRTAGSYVLYPGTEQETCREYHEILPGLGAFVLRPTVTGAADGSASLIQFLDDVLTHVASQLTQHERSRFWIRETFKDATYQVGSTWAAPFLRRPPADTLVLLGYVKNAEHYRWIRDEQRYNLRADGRRGSVGLSARELSAELVILYGPDLSVAELWRVSGGAELWSRERMTAAGYPDPSADSYVCLMLEGVPADQWPKDITPEHIQLVRAQARPGALPGQPVCVSWLSLVQAGAAPG